MGPSVSKVWCLFFCTPPAPLGGVVSLIFAPPAPPPLGVSEVPSFDFCTPHLAVGVSEVPSFELCTTTVQNRWHPLNFAPNELLHVNVVTRVLMMNNA